MKIGEYYYIKYNFFYLDDLKISKRLTKLSKSGHYIKFYRYRRRTPGNTSKGN